jgi:hypothetical protein
MRFLLFSLYVLFFKIFLADCRDTTILISAVPLVTFFIFKQDEDLFFLVPLLGALSYYFNLLYLIPFMIIGSTLEYRFQFDKMVMSERAFSLYENLKSFVKEKLHFRGYLTIATGVLTYYYETTKRKLFPDAILLMAGSHGRGIINFRHRNVTISSKIPTLAGIYNILFLGSENVTASRVSTHDAQWVTIPSFRTPFITHLRGKTLYIPVQRSDYPEIKSLLFLIEESSEAIIFPLSPSHLLNIGEYVPLFKEMLKVGPTSPIELVEAYD